MPRDYIDAAEVAKLIRQALKESFEHKFSVRTSKYAGGASIRIRWIDGPPRDAVERVTGVFEGSYFDGMIDYKGCIYHTLDGESVRFGADFIFEERDMSDEALKIGIEALRAYGRERYLRDVSPAELVEIEGYGGHRYRKVEVNPDFGGASKDQYHDDALLDGQGRFVRAELALERWFDAARPFKVNPSPTLARIAIAGSDGYGNVGIPPIDGGEGYRGYPRNDPLAGVPRQGW